MLTQKRIEQHQKARELMDASSFHSASEVIINAIHDYGPHVGLLSDLASSAYLGGQIDLFVRTTKELQTQFEAHQNFLSDRSYMRTCLSLGKLLEEIGEVAMALSLYERALTDRKFFQLSQIAFCQKVQIQILRLKAYLGIRSDLGDIYQNCAQMSATDADLGIEIDHGLMLAECQLLGVDAARERFQTLLGKAERKTDLRLIYFDLTEELLRLDQKPPELPFKLTDLDYFEKVLFFMSASNEFTMSIQELQKVQKKMSPMCYLRVCVLNLSRNAQPEIRRQILLLLEGLSSESRQVLLRKWAVELGTARARLPMKLDLTSLSLNGQTLPLIAEGFEQKCLMLLKDQRSWTTEDLIQKAFNIIPDEFALERLRVAILRLNKKLAKLTGLPKTLQHSKLKVSLHSEVEINSES